MQIINDFINLTQGQLLIKYWWLWLSVIIIFILYENYGKIKRRIRKMTKKNKSDNLYLRPRENGEIRITVPGSEEKYKSVRARAMITRTDGTYIGTDGELKVINKRLSKSDHH